jgi:TRAP-type C4-dicarboxylate transport system substrate-binding protein
VLEWEEISMKNRLLPIAAAFCAVALASGVDARELTFGSWTPPRDAYNTKTLPAVFEQIKQDTKGSITWKLITGGALLDARGTVPGVKDGLADGGLGIAPYVPNLLPATNMIFSTSVWGNDVVAATAASVETAILNCQECLDEHKAQNALPLGGFTASAYMPMCRDNVKSLAELKGKRVRASGGGVALMEALGAIPVAMDPASATTALQRGTVDCVHGDPQWLEGFGYMDVTKSVFFHPMGIGGPAMALYLNRNTWQSLTPDEKKAMVRGAALASAMQAINSFILEGERVLNEAKAKGIALNPGGKDVDDIIAGFAKKQQDGNIEAAKKFGVKNAEAIMAAYLKNVEKWRGLSPEIGRDVNKMRDALMREVYDKFDQAKF